MAEKIKIGLDFHGVINNNPAYFRDFNREAMTQGWEIHIITGGPYEKVEAYLKNKKIPYTRLFAVFDFYNRQGLAEVRADGEFKIEKKLWDSAKAEYCLKNGISLHIDDSLEYGKNFLTPYCTYDAGNKNCRLDENNLLDLKAPVKETLSNIAHFLKQKNRERF